MLTRSAALATVMATVSLLATGCSGAAGAAAPEPAAPRLGAVIPANYTLLRQQRIALLPGHGPKMLVLTSAGQGDPQHPALAGTGDVQVLSYDTAVHRWNVALDAAHPVRAIGDAEPAQPLLDQKDTIDEVVAKPVWFAGQPVPDLLVYGMDEAANRPVGDAAVVRFRTGSAQVLWRAALANMTVPRVVGTGARQTLRLTADYVTAADGACCPVRDYHQTIGARAGGVGVVADDRPYLGAWISPSTLDPRNAVVLGVDPGSPAAGILRPGDVISAVNGKRAKSAAAGAVAGQVDQVAALPASSVVALRVQRGATTQTVRVRLGSAVANGHSLDQAQAGRLGIQLDTGSFAILNVGTGPAVAAGLRNGDQLVALNGIPVRSMDDIAAALWNQVGAPVTVVFDRPGAGRMSTSVTPRAETAAEYTDPATQL